MAMGGAAVGRWTLAWVDDRRMRTNLVPGGRREKQPVRVRKRGYGAKASGIFEYFCTDREPLEARASSQFEADFESLPSSWHGTSVGGVAQTFVRCPREDRARKRRKIRCQEFPTG